MLRSITLAAVLLCALAPAALAQGVTTSAMNGLVLDQSRQPLPGANVVAVHEPTGTRYGTITRADGRYNLTNLQVGGPYSVTVSFIGFQAVQETGITLALGENRVQNFTLREAAAALDEVVVLGTGDATFNASRTGASTNVSTEQIERLPTIARSIQDFTRLSPQVSGNSVGGRNNRYNNIQLDGAILNDAFGLPASGTPGGQVGAQPVALDAIAEFQVEAAPYDVRRAGFTGGLINAVTRRGTNDFDGSAYFFGRNQNFVGLSPDANRTRLEDFGEFQTGFRLGGPIQRNRLFFFANVETRRLNEPFGGGLAGSGAANEFVLGQADLERIRTIAQNYGLNPGSFGPASNNTNDVKLFGRLDWNINDNNRLTLRHNFVDAGADRGIFRSASSWSFDDINYVFRSRQNSSVAQLNSTLGSNLFGEARIGWTTVRDQRDYGDRPPAPSITIFVPGGRVDLGQERSSQQNALDQDILELTANATLFANNLTFVFGTDNQYSRFSNLFLQDFYGSYEFQGIDAFEAGQPSRYRYSYANEQFFPRGAAPRAEWGYIRAGLFGQAEWRALPGLNLTGGLRLDVPYFLDRPLRNETFEQAFGLRTDEVPSGNIQLSPRVAFNYDVTGDRSTQLRGGVGIFSGPPLGVWLSNQYSNTGVDILRVDVRNRPAGFFVPDPERQPRPGETAGLSPVATAAIALTDRNFTFPKVLRTSLGVDQRLPFYGLVATAEVQYSPVLNDVYFTNLNLGDQVGTNAVDGRPVFTALRDSRFTSAILMSNTDRGYTTNLTFQLERPSQQGFFGRMAYNFQQSRAVNSGGSSVALSNWNQNYTTGNPNDEAVSRTFFEVPHRILGVLSYNADLFASLAGRRGFATTFSLIYEGNSGLPYSYIFNRDVNGDGESFNDLVYIPRESDRNLFVISDADWAALNSYISNSSSLNARRGQIAERNGATAPWQNRFDLRLAQQVPTVSGQRAELTLDLINAGNLLNNEWGRVRTVGRSHTLVELDTTPINADGQYVVTRVNTENVATPSNLLSRWQLQFGLRYSF
ncbi:MAG: carboxypeptidase regulatory-like domain-containing protein [Rubricoccaceae bacterium]